MNHANAEFEAKYGFCLQDCAECDRLDREDTRTPDEQRAAALTLAVHALADLTGDDE